MQVHRYSVAKRANRAGSSIESVVVLVAFEEAVSGVRFVCTGFDVVVHRELKVAKLKGELSCFYV